LQARCNKYYLPEQNKKLNMEIERTDATIPASVVYKRYMSEPESSRCPVIFPYHFRNNTNNVITPIPIETHQTAEVVPATAMQTAPKIGAITFGK